MEESKPKFNWVRLLITSLIVLVTAGAVGGTTYYVLNSNFQKERDTNETALNGIREQLNKERSLKIPKSEVETASAVEEKEVRQLIDDFEESYKQAYLGQTSGNRLNLLNKMFAYFTPPLTNAEKELKNAFIFGKDLEGNPGGPAMFSTGGTDAYTLNFDITNLSSIDGKYIVKVTETKRKYYNGGSNPGYQNSSFNSILDVIKSGSTWLIDRYYTNNYDDKYSAFQN